MSTITVTSTSSPVIFPSATETLSIDVNDYADADGEHVSNLAGGTLSFTVDESLGTGPGQGSLVIINPLPILTAEPGSTLTYPVTASDLVAGKSLVYSLGPGAPGGASINPLSGLFTWTPTALQAAATYSIPVIAAVSGELNVSNSACAVGDGRRAAERGKREGDGTEEGPHEQGDWHDHGDFQPGDGGIGGVVEFLFGRHAQDRARPQEKADAARPGPVHVEADCA